MRIQTATHTSPGSPALHPPPPASAAPVPATLLCAAPAPATRAYSRPKNLLRHLLILCLCTRCPLCTGLSDSWSVANSKTEQHPPVLARPCPAPAFCPWRVFNQRISFIREVKKYKSKDSQPGQNNDSLVSRQSQGPLTPSQGLWIIF